VKAERVNGTSTYSVVGAGDAFVAGVVFKLASSSKVKFNFKENVDAAAFGSKVAALCVATTKNSLGSTSENVRKLEKIVNSQNSSRIVELKPLIAAFP
jgi:sugar/nucleoside kinase (ribokinase family)